MADNGDTIKRTIYVSPIRTCMNERFKQNACTIFALEYKELQFENIDESEDDMHEIESVLHHFGHLMHSLHASLTYEARYNDKMSKNCRGFLKLISKYCGESMSDLKLEGFFLHDDELIMLQPLFSKLEKLSLDSCTITNKTANILSKCSKLVSLNLHRSWIQSDKFMQQRFVKLMELSTHLVDGLDSSTIKLFCEKNPQLRKLSICIYKGIGQCTILPLIGNYLPNIEDLTFREIGIVLTQSAFDEKVQHVSKLKTLTSLALNCDGFSISSLMTAIAKENVKLERLDLIHGEIDSNLIATISDIKTIKSLTFLNFYGICDAHLIHLGKNLPKLNQMHILLSNEITFDGVTKFIRHAVKLTLLTLELTENVIVDLEIYNRFLQVVKSRPNEMSLLLSFAGAKKQLAVPEDLIKQNSKWLNVAIDDSFFSDDPKASH